MVSNTKSTENRRRARDAASSRRKKNARLKAGTPKFPIHPETAAKAGTAKK